MKLTWREIYLLNKMYRRDFVEEESSDLETSRGRRKESGEGKWPEGNF